jgi:hypothetical protein
MESAPRTGNPAIRQGLIFGIILAVVVIAFTFLAQVLPLGALNGIIVLAIYIIFGLIAGRRASALTGRMATGVLAGFLAGLIGSMIPSIIGLVFDLFNIDAVRQAFQQAANRQGVHVTYTNALVIQSIILGLIFNVVLYSLIALVGGAIGGFMGRSRAPLPQQQEYQESMFVPPSSAPAPTPTPPEDESSKS